MDRALRQRTWRRIALWQPEEADAVLYAASALFAELTARLSSISLYRQWGELAVGPYMVGAVASALVARSRRARAAEELGLPAGRLDEPMSTPPRARRQWGAGRIWVFVFVLLGATVLPLSLEVSWRAEGDPSAHVQPETVVVEQAAHLAAHGDDPYRLVTNDGRVVDEVKGEPAYESFFPYLPLMTLFGLPSSTKEPIRLTDARIFFSMVTLLVVIVALGLTPGDDEPKVRTLQVLTVLPTAALPLATGGDDMPIVALLLLAMVLAQRRRPGWSGFVLGIAASMKFTAWPLAALALFAARDRQGRRAPISMVLGMLVVAGPVVIPFALHAPHAFFENVILFPLGLSGVASPAASALPGHLIVSAFPSLHRIFPLTVGLVGGAFLALRLVRHPPVNASQVLVVTGWVTLIAFMLAPSTRVGYLLYPVNFFVWSRMLREERPVEAEAQVPVEALSAGST